MRIRTIWSQESTSSLISADYEKDVEESDETNNVYSNINFRFTVTAP